MLAPAFEKQWVDTGKCNAYLQRVTAVRFTVNHLHYIFINGLTGLITIAPVVRGTYAVLAHIEVFRVIDVLIWACLDTIYNLELKQPHVNSAAIEQVDWESTRHTRGSRSIRIARGMYRVSSL